jgi:hypothetical protein
VLPTVNSASDAKHKHMVPADLHSPLKWLVGDQQIPRPARAFRALVDFRQLPKRAREPGASQESQSQHLPGSINGNG